MGSASGTSSPGAAMAVRPRSAKRRSAIAANPPPAIPARRGRFGGRGGKAPRQPLCGHEEYGVFQARITARNRLSLTGTARSALLAVGPGSTLLYRNGGETASFGGNPKVIRGPPVLKPDTYLMPSCHCDASVRGHYRQFEPHPLSPVATGSIPGQTVMAGATATVDVSPYFSDPDGDALTYAATTSDATVAGASVSGSTLTVAGVAAGSATATVTARDPQGAGGTTELYGHGGGKCRPRGTRRVVRCGRRGKLVAARQLADRRTASRLVRGSCEPCWSGRLADLGKKQSTGPDPARNRQPACTRNS